MKNILIVNSSAFTIGDVAISRCMINQILMVIPDAQISIESGNPLIHKKYLGDSGKKINIVKRLFDVTDLSYSPHYLSLSFFKKNSKVIVGYLFDAFELLYFSLLKKSISNREVFKKMHAADIVINAGGDAITKHYAFFIRLYVLLVLKSMNKKVVIYASTIGPFSGLSKFLTINCLKRLDLILCRDENTYRFLVDNGLSLTIVKRTADCVVLLDKKSTTRVEKIITRLNITKKTVGIFLKVFLYADPKKYEEYLMEVKNVVIGLKKHGYDVVLFSANNADYGLSNRFLKKFDLKNSIINLMDFSPDEGKEILSRLGLVITSRMHPAILASTANVPVIGVSDELKMLGYLKTINLSDLYLKSSDFKAPFVVDLVVGIFENKMIKNMLNEGLLKARSLADYNIKYLKDSLIGK